MMLSEFKAWFEGYTENIDKAPTHKQWARIKERVGEIDGVAVTRDGFWNFWPSWPSASPRYYPPVWICSNTKGLSNSTISNTDFDSNQAMFALGAAEAAGQLS